MVLQGGPGTYQQGIEGMEKGDCVNRGGTLWVCVLCVLPPPSGEKRLLHKRWWLYKRWCLHKRWCLYAPLYVCVVQRGDVS